MYEPGALRAHFGDAMSGASSPLDAANRLCHACVELLEVDGASISLMYEGSSRGTFGSSGKLSRRLDEFQFTFGEGPCLDAVSGGQPVLVADLGSPAEMRWPAFREAVIESGVRAVFALPVLIAFAHIGALDLYNQRTGDLSSNALAGAMLAAELAALPLLDVMAARADWGEAGDSGRGWEQLASLERVEVYQATGMVMAMLDVAPAEALARIRAHAYSHSMTASEVAWAIVERRLTLEADGFPRKNL